MASRKERQKRFLYRIKRRMSANNSLASLDLRAKSVCIMGQILARKSRLTSERGQQMRRLGQCFDLQGKPLRKVRRLGSRRFKFLRGR